MTLPLRIIPHHGEPAYAAFARLASRHSVDDLRNFAARVGVSWSGTIANIEASAVAMLAGINSERLERFTPKVNPKKRSVELAGQRLLLNDWSSRRRKYCAACFADDRRAAISAGIPSDLGPWHRSWWDIQSYDVCHVHEVVLGDACPICHAPLRWTHTRVDRCQCGADLCTTETAPSDASVSTYIARRLGLTTCQTYPLLEPLELHDALAVLVRLGFCKLLEYRAQRPRANAKEREVARRAGLELAHEWPQAFEECLDRLVHRTGRDMAQAGMIGTYGWIYSAWATTETVEPFGSEIRHRLREHAIKNSIAQRGEALFGQRHLQGHGVTEAARRLGISVRRLAREVVASGVAPAGRRPGVATALPDVWVDQLADNIRTTVDMQGVAAALGIGRARAREIVELDLIPPVMVMGTRRFRQSDVAALLASLRENSSQTTASLRSPSLVPLPRACQSAGVPIAQTIRALRDRRLSATSVNDKAVGLHALIVDAHEVRRLLRHVEHKLSVEEAARRLSVHPDTVRYLIRIGALQRTDRKTLMLDEISLCQTQNDLVPCTALSQQLKISPKIIIRHASRLGIYPSHGPPMCRNILFDRQNAEIALASLLRSQK